MKKIKEKMIENDFGMYIYDLRYKKGWTIEEFAEKANIESITIKKVRKWEHDLEFPELEEMYKISEIYEIPAEILMQVRTNTLQEGIKAVPKTLIRIISYILGFSIYGMIILEWVIIAFFAIWVWFLWADVAKNMGEAYQWLKAK